MRKILILLISVFLTACVDDSASYFIDGREHSLTIRRQQEHFWKDEADVTLLAARMPECQRLHPLASVAPAADVKVDLFSAGDGLWNLRMGQQLWQIETATCNGLTELQNDPKADLGQALGSFIVKDGKLAFEALPGAADAADAADAAAAPAAQ
ncbi:MAG TPA: hypothetical protein DCW29_08430 [Janthinobacterium sp.]|nr:hypothetical protein [Janthinobacterium sp.]